MMNAALFAVMPCLIRHDPAQRSFEQMIPHVNVVRVKRPETPVKKEIERKQKPEKPKMQNRPEPRTVKPKIMNLSLPFEINPRLPAGLNTITLPEMPPPKFETSGIEDTFSAGDLDAPLTVLSRIPPTYPIKARYRNIEGWVRVRFLVGEDGSVDNVKIVKSEPPEIFDRSVIQCVSKWRFKPGTVEGIKVKTWAETTIRFQLK